MFKILSDKVPIDSAIALVVLSYLAGMFKTFKGPGSIRGCFGLTFSENLKVFILCGVYSHN